MSRKVSIFETRSQRKDRALHCPFSSIDDCKPALHSQSLERNMCIPEHPMKKHWYACALRSAQLHFVASMACCGHWETRPDKPSEADTAPQTRWKAKPDGEQMRRQNWVGDKARWETNWETRPQTSPARRTQHPSQGERQSHVGDKLGDKTGDKPSEADTAPQPRWKTKPDGKQMGRENWETKPDGRQIGRQIGRQAQRGGHSTPPKVKDKARWETNWETGDKLCEADTAPQPRRTHLRQHWEPQQ